MRLLYQFSASSSLLHRLDPRSKLLFIACLLVPLWGLPMPWPLIMGLGFMALIWIGAKISPKDYWSFLLFLIPLMFAITLIQALTLGAPYYYLVVSGVKVFRLSVPGVQMGVLVAFRLAAMGIGFIGFSMTTEPFDWGLSLYRSGLPYKAAFMFGFAMRFFPLLQEELLVIRNALKARASDLVGSRNPFKTLAGAGVSVIPLGLGALRRSQSIALAMELRGYSIPEELKIKRVIYRDIRYRPRDWAASAISLAILAATIVWLSVT